MRLSCLFFASWMLSGCAQLDAVDGATCGNSVVEAGEDCDPGPDGSHAGTCGAPGSDRACRFECASDADCATTSGVPVGDRCDRNRGVCVAPNGLFKAVAPVQLGPVKGLTLGDFTGDGTTDVAAIGVLQTTFLSFDEAGGVATSSTVPTRLSNGVFGAFTDATPTRSDYAVPFGQGATFGTRLGVFLSNGEGAFSPVLYPSGSVPPGVIIRSAGAAHSADDKVDGMIVEEPIVLSQATGDAMVAPGLFVSHLNLVSHEKPKPCAMIDPKGTIADVDAYTLANLKGESSCGELIVLRKGAPHVEVVSLCDTSSDWRHQLGVKTDNPLVDLVPLPGGATFGASASAIVATLDPELGTGLLLGPAGGSMLFLTYDGTKLPAERYTLTSLDGRFKGIDPFTFGFKGATAPLAVGNLDGDDVLDFATANGAFACDTNHVCTLVAQPSSPWSEAAIADFNADGFGDVVGGRSCAVGVEFWNGTGTPTASFNLTVIPTDAPVKSFAVGDFDGDLIPDLALAQSGERPANVTCAASNFPGGPDVPSVLFGRPWQALEAPFALGQTPSVAQTLGAKLLKQGSITDLAIITEAQTTMGEQMLVSDTFSLLPGSTTRLLISPFGLTSPVLGVDADVLSLSAGRFDAKSPARSQVAALAKDRPGGALRLWFVELTGEGIIATATPSDRIDLFSDPTNTINLRTHLPSTDVAVLLGRSATGKLAFLTAHPDASKSPLAFELGSKGELDVVLPTDKSRPIAHAGDFDGDGNPDLAVVGELAVPGHPDAPTHELRIYWGDGNGGFGPAFARATAPPLEVNQPPSKITSLTSMHVAGSVHVVPVIASNDVLYVVPVASDRSIGAIGKPLATEQSASNGSKGSASISVPATSVVNVFDANGDGVDDVMIGQSSGLTLYLGEARAPGPSSP